jgi:hypothetical protein
MCFGIRLVAEHSSATIVPRIARITCTTDHVVSSYHPGHRASRMTGRAAGAVRVTEERVVGRSGSSDSGAGGW